MMAQKILKMKGISIEFPGVKALDSVDFTMKSGTTHALIGANGAGKSTLMKVLSGSHDHYTGVIEIDGENVQIHSPKDAQAAGIQIVHQEVDTALIPYLTVGENIMLTHTVTKMEKKQLIKWKELHKQASDILAELKIKVSSKKLVSELTLAEKQMILIARTVTSDCQFLILDEPTAPLSHAETNELFRIVRELKAKNVGIIFISHRLPEIFEICEEITIMRNGQLVTHDLLRNTTTSKVVESMLGRELKEQFPSKPSLQGDVMFEVKNVVDSEKLQDISLSVRKGEIVGIAGLVGAGKTELCKALFGETKIVSGEVKLNGKRVRLASPYHAVKEGIALVPEERRKEGVLVSETVVTNLTAASLSAFTRPLSFLNKKAEKAKALKVIEDLGIKTPSEEARVQNLSGGNQQKIAIGKWLIADAEVYIFDEPTKGVDVGAKRDIFELITALAHKGKAVIYASSELAEIVGVSNRVYVLYDGKVVKELPTQTTSEEELLFYSTGGIKA